MKRKTLNHFLRLFCVFSSCSSSASQNKRRGERAKTITINHIGCITRWNISAGTRFPSRTMDGGNVTHRRDLCAADGCFGRFRWIEISFVFPASTRCIPFDMVYEHEIVGDNLKVHRCNGNYGEPKHCDCNEMCALHFRWRNEHSNQRKVIIEYWRRGENPTLELESIFQCAMQVRSLSLSLSRSVPLKFPRTCAQIVRFQCIKQCTARLWAQRFVQIEIN